MKTFGAFTESLDVAWQEAYGQMDNCKACRHPKTEHTDDGCEHSGCRCMEISEDSKSLSLKCLECGKAFKSASLDPKCPKCGGYDIDLGESVDDPKGTIKTSSKCPTCGNERWKTESGRLWCRTCGKYDRKFGVEEEDKHLKTIKEFPFGNESGGLSEDSLPHHDIQRVFDETGDIGETEILCGVSNLKINRQGQVVSFIGEAVTRRRGQFREDRKLAQTFIDKLRREYPGKTDYALYAQALADAWRRTGDLDDVPLKVAGGYDVTPLPKAAKAIKADVRLWLEESFKCPVIGKLLPLTEDAARRDVGTLEVEIQRIRNYDGKDTYIAKTMVPSRNGMMKFGEETSPLPTVAAAIQALKMRLITRTGVTGALRFKPSNDRITQKWLAGYFGRQV